MQAAPRGRGRRPAIFAPAEPPVSEWLSRAAFARWFGVAPQTVTRWIKDGKLPPDVMRPDGAIHAERGLDALRSSGALADGEGPPQEFSDVAKAVGNVSYDEARAFTELLRAHRAYLDLCHRRGQLILRDVADGVVFEFGRAFRDQLTNWPPRVAAEMGSEIGVAPAPMLAALEKYIHAFLEEMSAPDVDWRAKAQETLEE